MLTKPFHSKMDFVVKIIYLLFIMSVLMASWIECGKKGARLTALGKPSIFLPDKGGLKVKLAFMSAQGEMNKDIADELESAFKLSVELINEESKRNDSVIHFTYTLINNQCTNSYASRLVNSTVVGIVGPSQAACSQLVRGTLGVNLTHISYLPIQSVEKSERSKYSGLLSVCPSRQRQAQVLAAIIKRYGWKSVNIVGGTSDISLALEIQLEIEAFDVSVDQIITVDLRIINKQLQELKRSSARVIVMLVTETTERDNILQRAFQKGLMEKGWYWLAADSLTLTDTKSLGNLGETMQGMLGVYPRSGSGLVYHKLISKWLDKKEMYYPGQIWKTKFDEVVGVFVPQVYDAVYTYYSALRSLVNTGVINQNSEIKTVRQAVLRELQRYTNLSKAFVGATGERVYFDSEVWDGPTSYDIVNFQDKSWRKVGWYGHDELSILRLIVWPGGNMNPKYSAVMSLESRNYEDLAVVMAVVMSIFLVMAVVLYRMVLNHRDKARKLKVAYTLLTKDKSDPGQLKFSCSDLEDETTNKETNL